MQTINEVKAEIESKTAFRFMYGKDRLDKDVLRLVRLPSKCEITMNIGKYHNGEAHISVSGSDERDGYGCFVYPADSIDEVIKHLKFMAERYGWEQSTQTSLF